MGWSNFDCILPGKDFKALYSTKLEHHATIVITVLKALDSSWIIEQCTLSTVFSVRLWCCNQWGCLIAFPFFWIFIGFGFISVCRQQSFGLALALFCFGLLDVEILHHGFGISLHCYDFSLLLAWQNSVWAVEYGSNENVDGWSSGWETSDLHICKIWVSIHAFIICWYIFDNNIGL